MSVYMFVSAHVCMRVHTLAYLVFMFGVFVCVCPNVYLAGKQNNPPRVCAPRAHNDYIHRLH